MSVILVRPVVRPEAVGEVRAAVQTMFEALHEARPQGVKYASYTSGDGARFTVLLEVEDGLENPLLEIPAVVEFQRVLAGCLVEQPVAEQLTLVGEYRA